jgi:30S ribosomal protein S31
VSEAKQFLPTFAKQKNSIMGRGDKKTRKGKTFKGSFGKSRPAGPKKITGNKPAAKKES